MPADAPAQPAITSASPHARIAATLTWVCVVGLMLLGTWASYWAEQRTDQYQLIHLGQCVYDGGRMYVDCWENKPPGLAWINALAIALSGGGQLGAWLLPGLVGLLSLAVFGTAVKRMLSPATARLTVLLAAVMASLRLYDTPSINPDFYSAMFELAAFSVWLLALAGSTWPRRVLWALAAGLLWATAGAVKQTGVVGLLTVSLVSVGLVCFPRLQRKKWFITTGVAWFGFLMGVSLVVVALAWGGTLGEAWGAIYTFNRGLLRWDYLSATALSAWQRRMMLEPMHLPLWLGLLGLVATCGRNATRRLVVRQSVPFGHDDSGCHCSRAVEDTQSTAQEQWHTHSPRRDAELARPVLIVLVLWWLAQVLLAFAGPSHSQRYWQATFPALFWLAAFGFYQIEGMFRALEPPRRVPAVILCATLLCLLGWPLGEHYSYGVARSYLAYQKPVTQRADLISIGKELDAVLPPKVPICVWAYSPQTYIYSHHPAACRFNYPRSQEQMEEILSTLEAGKAQAILIPKRPSSEFAAWCDNACEQRRSKLLSDYELSGTVGNFDVWLRHPPDRQ